MAFAIQHKQTRPDLYLCGIPGKLGGASTKIVHLIRLLHQDFNIKVVAPELWVCKDKSVKQALEPYDVRCALLKELPGRMKGTALGICDANFFISGRAKELKSRGLDLVWSNEMMWPFKGEVEAVKMGLIDRVLFVSQFQADAFNELYQEIPSILTGNYIDPDDYSRRERANPIFSIGRLSRPDPFKYPLDFPVFYEGMGLKDVRYRVMAWSTDLQRQYRWHRFGPEWELLPANKQSALSFLYSLDVFLYPLGHRIKESWGRAVVEAMLTGCVPVVPTGQQFHRLMLHGENGFICREFLEFKSCVRELYENYALRQRMSCRASDFARNHLCNPDDHRQVWIKALSF